VKDLRLPHGRHKLRLVNPIRKLKKTLVVDLPGRRRYSVNLED
jgi:hypothetical protein